jgi:hypothetical protein
MTVRFVSGGVLRVPLDDGGSAWAVMLGRTGYLAFYRADGGQGPAAALAGGPAFIAKPSECFLVDPDENLTPVTPEECEGYERESAWAAEHVEMRLNDLYAGRSSKVVAATRVRR